MLLHVFVTELVMCNVLVLGIEKCETSVQPIPDPVLTADTS